MIDRNSQMGWTEAQWNRVRQAVTEEWQRARVAGSILPMYGPLPPSTQVVPSEIVETDGRINDVATTQLVELWSEVKLSQQQVNEDGLASALVAFRRAATAVARSEDRIIFNGQQSSATYTPYPQEVPQGADQPAHEQADSAHQPAAPAPQPAVQPRFPPVERRGGEPLIWTKEMADPQHLPRVSRELQERLRDVIDHGITRLESDPKPGSATLRELVRTAPGALGLVFAAAGRAQPAVLIGSNVVPDGTPIVGAIVGAITWLEQCGYGRPFWCFFGEAPYIAAHTPLPNTLVEPADRIEPLLGNKIIYASALNEGPTPPAPFAGRGLVISLSGAPIDLALAVSATAEFTNMDRDGKYNFRVFERFVLRVKDPAAIFRLEFTKTP